MAIGTVQMGAGRDVGRPGDLRTTWLIARRGAAESLRDRMTVGVSAIFSLVIPLVVVLLILRGLAERTGADSGDTLGAGIATYLLVVGLMPSSGSIGIASGLFAGEKEQGNLLPLLATPASNRAIFAGKILGAVLPALLYAAIAEASYLTEVWLALGADALQRVPLALACAMVALVPAVAVLGAAVASLISSRVRTYQSAQLLSGLALYPIMAVLFGLALQMQAWRAGALVLAVGAIVAVDALVVVLGAATWRREEVMARR
jgi:ABC-type Na+ efflux pump permease subunit